MEDIRRRYNLIIVCQNSSPIKIYWVNFVAKLYSNKNPIYFDLKMGKTFCFMKHPRKEFQISISKIVFEQLLK